MPTPAPSGPSSEPDLTAAGDTPNARKGSRFFSAGGGQRIWAILCLFQVGLLAGLISIGRNIWTDSGEPVGGTPGHSLGLPPIDPNSSHPFPPNKVVGDLGRGDQLLREGRFESALAVFQALTDGAALKPDSLRYRLALCHEGLGQWDQAIAAYRAIAGRGTYSRVGTAAQLGQARVWIRLRKLAEAKRLLCDLILRSGEPALFEQPLLPDACFLLALGLSMEVIRAEPPGPFTDAVVPHRIADWPTESLLDWVALGKDREIVGPHPTEGKIAVQRLGRGGDEVLVQASLRQTDVAELLNRLANLSGLQTDWSPEARRLIAGRTVTVVVDQVPLPDILRALSDPLALVWRIEGGLVRWASEGETSAEALDVFRKETARRALREAVVAHPDHLLSAVAQLELCNLEVVDGNLRQAAASYTRVIRERPHSSLLIGANYNLGNLYRRLGDMAASEQALYQVVDRAPGNELAPLAYLKIGRLHLDQGEFDRAVSPLRRALVSGAGTSTQPAAAIHLAVAYLLTGNSRAAQAVLLETRDRVSLPPFRSAAAFLTTMARYRGTTDPKQSQREAGDLLATLLALPDDSILGSAGLMLAGQAYGELGLAEQQARSYEKALREAHGKLAAELTFTLANTLTATGRRAEALKLFEALSATEENVWASRALLSMAEIALQEKRPNDCLQFCVRVQSEKTNPDMTTLLKLMGRAYEQLGDPRRAARCYAGLFPEQ